MWLLHCSVWLEMSEVYEAEVACELPWLLQREEVVCCWMGNLSLFLPSCAPSTQEQWKPFL